jgi:hypothetical protein
LRNQHYVTPLAADECDSTHAEKHSYTLAARQDLLLQVNDPNSASQKHQLDP